MSEKINPGVGSAALLPPREVMEWKSSVQRGEGSSGGC